MAAVVKLPKSDPGLQSFAQNMSAKISADAGAYGCTPLDASNLATASDNFAAALSACNPVIRSRPAVVQKNSMRAALKDLIKQLAFKIRGTPGVSDTQKVALGLASPAVPVRIPAPQFAPAVDVVAVVGRTVKLRIHDSQGSGRGKPSLVAGALVFSHVGTQPPADPNLWKGEGITTRPGFDCNFPSIVPAGAQVWVTAKWYNSKAQTGPAARAMTAYLQGGGPVEEAA